MCMAGSTFLDPAGIFASPQVPRTPRPPPPAPSRPPETATRLRRARGVAASQQRARLGTSQLRIPLSGLNIPK